LFAHAQGKFWGLYERLFENQRALDRTGLEIHAAAVGLDKGTPTLFINGKRAANATDVEGVTLSIDAALAH
jgi:hypothetical protein